MSAQTVSRATVTVRQPKVIAACRGAHHTDYGWEATCDACGGPVVKTETGRILKPNVSDLGRMSYWCWNQPEHECRPEDVTFWAGLKAERAARGEILKGDTVRVVKGRKVPLGTVGIVRWIGQDSYGKLKLGLAVEGEKSLVFTAASNVQAVTA